MKLIISIVACFVCSMSFSQIVLSIPEYNVVYRGYDNKLKIGAGSETAFLDLESTQAQIYRTDSCFILKPTGSEKTITVIARNFKDKNVVGTWQFRVLNLPTPTIFWGMHPSGSAVVTLDKVNLRAGYDENSILENPGFEVVNYQVNSPLIEKPMSPINGGVVTQEVLDALTKAKSANKGKPVSFTVILQVKGKDGLIRKMTAEYTY
ncbi:GldM family protein [Fluviicola taffensis]|uniref:Uncharacterized protein n=1 Tax=Fluviicola taffensis (strain DSM 16823 / NCIMB 13979 / RW262) TaxID=755732 RepID=F2IE60_FLUTR|nr:GldM family protein [Fluviicola taffensis]AEA42378.1 hypothetical protein Fluta_0370 [Fluviicola taffensis DSM 16823]